MTVSWQSKIFPVPRPTASRWTDEAADEFLSPDTTDTAKTNRYLLQCIREFWRAYPEPVDVSDLVPDRFNNCIGDQALAWLVFQKIVANPDRRFVLTLTGRVAIKKALGADPDLADFFGKSGFAMGKHDPTRLVIEILKTHYYNQTASRRH